MKKKPTIPKRRYSYPSASSHPKIGYCVKCKRMIIGAHYDALPKAFDPQPLTPLGEILALASGVRTWFISGGNLWKRTSWAITTSPSGLGGLIVQEHYCQRTQPSGTAANIPTAILSDDPGF